MWRREKQKNLGDFYADGLRFYGESALIGSGSFRSALKVFRGGIDLYHLQLSMDLWNAHREESSIERRLSSLTYYFTSCSFTAYNVIQVEIEL